jgi:hypothetical protein
MVGAVAAVAAACGSSGAPVVQGPVVFRSADLLGWRAVDDPPGIAKLAPDLSGLHVTRRVDSPALVRRGDAVRATKLVFGTTTDAERALDRTQAESFQARLFEELHGRIRRLTFPAGYRITVTRPAELGQDTVELFAIRRGRSLVLVELLSARGFKPALRDRILAGVSR